MKCIFCGHLESKVIDSRSADDGGTIRRRRECLKCGGRFTSYERVESVPLVVVKKDATRQPFDRAKLLNGLLRACEKRPVSLDQLEKVIDEVESIIHNSLTREVSSYQIGELVMGRLREIDEVAYVRFASVYRRFEDVNSFMDELKKLLKEK
ncbi:MAG: transcriptional regulator NrdR [Clostridiales bacterium]|jgi:transcriptional repressor NrdR|nr:transcriptional regulator NrdR [Clostridiales bacterium]